MPLYTIAANEAWVPNAYGRAQLRVLGEDVSLTEDQAEYLVLSGQIVPADAYVPVPPSPLQAADVLILQRGPFSTKIEREDLPAFVEPALVNGNDEPAGLSPLVMSFLSA